MDGRIMNEIMDWLNGQWLEITELLAGLQAQLSDRLLPLIEELRPIWQDPLWQALALILLIVVVLFLGSWLIKTGKSVFTSLFEFLQKAVKTVAGWVWTPISWLLRLFGKGKEGGNKKSRWQWVSMIRVRRAVNAMQYLTTRRDWRYQSPWFLLIGEAQSGKSAFIQSVQQGRRAQLLAREKRLKDPGSGWHFFDHGVVIDQDNHIKSRSVEGLATNEQSDGVNINNAEVSEEARNERFNYLIQLLHWYRPERPVDGILLTISGKTLLHTTSSAELQILGEQLFNQLWQIQKKSGFVLPVYVVVTQCDHVSGFASFWQAQQSDRHNEMIGWSNPYRLDSAYSSEWVGQAFSGLFSDLQEAQLQVAASGKPISDIDHFMLFLQQFSALQAPLTEVMSGAFARSSFQEALPLRGIYFTGQLDQKVAFSEDLMSEKVFAERHLAFPLEKRRFSNQKTLRRFQWGSLLGAVVMVILMSADSYRLQGYMSYTEDNLRRLMEIKQDCTREGLDSYRMLDGLTQISDKPLLLSLPLSWFNTQSHKEAVMVADEMMKPVLFASLDCRLKLRAERLRLQTKDDTQVTDYRLEVKNLEVYSRLLSDFQLNRERFLTLAGPLESEHDVGRVFTPLLKYLYDRPIPPSVDPSADLVAEAVQLLSFNVNWDEKGHSLIGRTKQLKHLDVLTKQLQQTLINHANDVPLEAMQQVSENVTVTPLDQTLKPSVLLTDINDFQRWLEKTERDWLSATPLTSPCGSIYQVLNVLSETLIDDGFNEEHLNRIVARFSAQECDSVVRRNLKNLHVSPFGDLFVLSEEGRLVVAPVLERLTAQVGALEALNFVKGQYPPMSASAEAVVVWREAPLQSVVNSLLSYQQFILDHSRFETPFFATVLQSRLEQVVERLLGEAMVRPSQLPPSQYVIDDLTTYNEAQLGQSVASFKSVSELLLQIRSLLQQLGDNGNTIRLQQSSQMFVLQQLQLLDGLMASNQLYQPVADPRWDTRDFARTLFNLDTDKQIDSYLTSQRQRVSYLGFSYAAPLITYLQNSGGGSLNDKVAQRWLHTLTDLSQFEREVPDNQVVRLDDFVGVTLVGLTNDNCAEYSSLQNPPSNDSWFSTRQVQLERQVSVHCQDAGENKVINRYLTIRERFNRQLRGKFPFADIAKAGIREVSSRQLRRFFEFYRDASKNLLNEMNDLESDQPGSIPVSWRNFISQLNSADAFFQQTWDSKLKGWQVPLSVEFSPYSQYGNGGNQIISWNLHSGQKQLTYPDLFPGIDGEPMLAEKNTLFWQVGDPLKLGLRWATGSAFVPLQLPDVPMDAPLQVNQSNGTALFSSRGEWALFEWLAKYASDGVNSLKAAQLNERLLAFHVPVVLKGVDDAAVEQTTTPTAQAYVSQSNILLWAEVLNSEGDKERLLLPGVLPGFAPGFND